MNTNHKLEYYQIVYEVLENYEFQKRKKYKHHGDISVYHHSLKVSKLGFKIAKILNLNHKNIAIAGLLHDFYNNPWQENKEKKKILEKHGFTHASEALENSKLYFPHLMNNKIENSIERHMFPLNKIPPKCSEAWVITLADKIISIEDLFKTRNISTVIGLKIKFRKEI
ncbi:MAG: HD domain-containing protein [Bacilli bacterium]